VQAVGAAAMDAVALSGRDRGAGTAPSFRQRRHRGTPVRIALLSVSAGLGGSETSLLELVRGLAATPGVEPVVVLPRSGPLEPRGRAAGGGPRLLAMPDARPGVGEWAGGGGGGGGRRGGAAGGGGGRDAYAGPRARGTAARREPGRRPHERPEDARARGARRRSGRADRLARARVPVAPPHEPDPAAALPAPRIGHRRQLAQRRGGSRRDAGGRRADFDDLQRRRSRGVHAGRSVRRSRSAVGPVARVARDVPRRAARDVRAVERT